MEPASSSSAAPPEQVLFDVSNFPKAAEFVNAALSGNYRIICYGGAIRGGKTFSALGTLVLLHRRWAASRSIIVRDSFTTLVRNVLPSIQKAFPRNFLHPRHKATTTWRFRNESYCQLVSENAAQDPDLRAWNGLEYNFCLLEQVEELQEATFIKAMERLGSYMVPAGSQQPPPLLMLTVNPTQTWARKWFYEPWLAGTLPPGWLYIPARIDDNPHIAESYKESLQMMRQADPLHYEQFVAGNWDVQEKTGNEFYPNFNRSNHIQPAPYVAGLPILTCWDANALPYCAMLCAQPVRDATGNLLISIFQEYALRPPDSGLTATGKRFLADRQAKNWLASDVLLTGDATLRARKTGDGNQSNFKDVLAAVAPALDSQSDRLWPRHNVRVGSSRDFTNLVLRGGLPGVRVVVDPACVTAIEDWELSQLSADGGVFKERAVDKELGVSYEKRGHFSDLLRYLLVTILRAQYDAFLAVREGGA